MITLVAVPITVIGADHLFPVDIDTMLPVPVADDSPAHVIATGIATVFGHTVTEPWVFTTAGPCMSASEPDLGTVSVEGEDLEVVAVAVSGDITVKFPMYE